VPSVRERAIGIKAKAAILMMAMNHPRTPWYAKACGIVTVLYLLSPIDLIPDFVPVLGQLDDLILVPMGIWLTIRLMPGDVWAECKAEVAKRNAGKPPKDWRGILVIAAIWLVLLLFGIWVFSVILRAV